jgi:hypothetical protein
MSVSTSVPLFTSPYRFRLTFLLEVVLKLVAVAVPVEGLYVPVVVATVFAVLPGRANAVLTIVGSVLLKKIEMGLAT